MFLMKFLESTFDGGIVEWSKAQVNNTIGQTVNNMIEWK